MKQKNQPGMWHMNRKAVAGLLGLAFLFGGAGCDSGSKNTPNLPPVGSPPPPPGGMKGKNYGQEPSTSAPKSK